MRRVIKRQSCYAKHFTGTFRIAASDYLDPLFLPELATPARLRGQLDVIEALGTSVEVIDVQAGRDASAANVAEALTA